MNISKKLAASRYHRFTIKHQKHLFKTKLEAMRPQNWDLAKVSKAADLIEAGDGSFPMKWEALYAEDKPFSLSSLNSEAVANAVTYKALRIRATRAYAQRRDIWAKVFDFLPDEQIPTPAGKEHVLFHHEGSGDKPQNPVVGIVTFGYPSVSNMPNLGDEIYYANYTTYDSALDTIKDRMGISDVYVEPVGVITEAGQEINGTVGTLGIRVWWSPSTLSSDPFDTEDSPWTTSLKIKVNMISKLRNIDGLGYASNGRFLAHKVKACSGLFRIVSVVSDSTTAQDYMNKADEIRKALNVPGLMIAPFGPLNDDDELENGISNDADENGVHHTAFIFYVGDESKVVSDEVDSDKDGKPLAAVSGFMPIHSASHLLSSLVPKPLWVVA